MNWYDFPGLINRIVSVVMEILGIVKEIRDQNQTIIDHSKDIKAALSVEGKDEGNKTA